MGPLPATGGWVRLEVPAAAVGLAGRTVTGMAFSLYDGKATWDRAGKFTRTTVATKSYSFNGMTIATSQGGVLSYLHTDHLSSNSVSTNASGGETARRTYYAYGKERPGGIGTLPTDRTFTGQEQDGTGLHYYRARFSTTWGCQTPPDPNPNCTQGNMAHDRMPHA